MFRGVFSVKLQPRSPKRVRAIASKKSRKGGINDSESRVTFWGTWDTELVNRRLSFPFWQEKVSEAQAIVGMGYNLNKVKSIRV